MNNYISLQVKFFLSVIFSLLILPMTVNAANLSGSRLIDDLRNVLIDAEAANTQLANITFKQNNMCKELLKAHKIVHNLHSKIENMDVALGSSVIVDNDAIKVFDNLSSVFVNLATRSSDLSLNPMAVKCVEDMPEYNEGMSAMLAYSNSMSTMLGLVNDIGSMADHVLKMTDKILLKSGVSNDEATPLLLSQGIQDNNLKLTQALVLVAQRNSLSQVSVLSKSSYNKDLGSQIFTAHILSFDAATTLLTNFNMEREWGHIEAGVEGLAERVNVTYKKISSIKKNKMNFIDKDSYIAMADLSLVIKSVAMAIDEMAITTERLSFSTRDEILRESVDSMMRMSTKIVELAEQVRDMAGIILERGHEIGLTPEQLVAAQELQNINYTATLNLVETTQQKAVDLISVHSL